MNSDRLDPKNTLVIADFDGTMIQKVISGKKVLSLMAILVDEKYLGIDGVAEANNLVKYYYPIQNDSSMSQEDKNRFMLEWWEKSYQVMKNHHVTQDMIMEICHSPMVKFRKFLVEFLGYLELNQIPLIIYSASGVGYDAIEYLLKSHSLLTSNIKICSNDLVFDNNGYVDHVEPPIIHAANKTGDTLVKNNYLSQKPLRRQCLLIGDSLDDARMVEGLDFDLVYKVAFGDPKIPEFDRLYDLVLPIDGGYKPILALFK